MTNIKETQIEKEIINDFKELEKIYGNIDSFEAYKFYCKLHSLPINKPECLKHYIKMINFYNSRTTVYNKVGA